MASPNRARISAPDLRLDAFTSRTLNPSSFAAAYAAAVLPHPTGPARRTPVAGTPRRSTAGAKPSPDPNPNIGSSESEPESQESDAWDPSRSAPAFVRLRRLFAFLFEADFLPLPAGPRGSPGWAPAPETASDSTRVFHAPSQRLSVRAAAASPTTSPVRAGAYASAHSIPADAAASSFAFAASPRRLISKRRLRSCPRVAARAPDNTDSTLHRPRLARTYFAASVRAASSISSGSGGAVDAPFDAPFDASFDAPFAASSDSGSDSGSSSREKRTALGARSRGATDAEKEGRDDREGRSRRKAPPHEDSNRALVAARSASARSGARPMCTGGMARSIGAGRGSR